MSEGFDAVVDYLLMTASRKPSLLKQSVKEATLEELVEGDILLVDDEQQGRFSLLLGESLEAMSQDIHDEEDRASSSGNITKAQAIILIKEHGGLRPAARATGICRMRLWRALHNEELAA